MEVMDTWLDLVHNIYFLVGVNIFLLISLAFMSLRRFRHFHALDKAPKIFPILPVKHFRRPIHPPSVRCGIFINEFPLFQVHQSTFIADLFVWFLFHPSQVNFKTVEGFMFENGEITDRSEGETKLLDDLLLVQYKVRVKFMNTLNFKDFPFDNHRISLTLILPNVSPEEVQFRGSNLGVGWNPSICITGWRIRDTDIRLGIKSAMIDRSNQRLADYPAINFTVDVQRRDLRQALIIILPLMAVFFITYCSLAFTSEESEAGLFGATTRGIIAFLGYRFVLEIISPKVAYFTVMDHIFFLFLTSTAFIFLLQLYRSMHEFTGIVNQSINLFGMLFIPLFLWTSFLILMRKTKAKRKS